MKFDKKYLLAVVGIVALYAIFLIISDLQIVLDKIQNLSSLDLSDNGYLTDIGLLSKCFHLTSLDLSSCGSLKNVEGIATLETLKCLEITDCGNVNPKPSIEEMTTREELAAYQVEIKKSMK